MFLFGTTGQLRQFICDIEHELPPGWCRNHKGEEQSKSGSVIMCCFTCSRRERRPPAEVWLSMDMGGAPILRLTTALSLYSDRLTQEEFEIVMDEFVGVIAIPAARNLGIEVVFNPKGPSLSDRMPPGVLMELDNYTQRVNKTGRNCHPNDHALWTHFVVSAYEARAEIDYAFVQDWFYRYGWTIEDARFLAISFNDSTKALAECERRRRLM